MENRTKHPQENILETFNFNGAIIELVEWIDTIWCGKIGYAVNNTDEPNVEKIMGDFETLHRSNIVAKEREKDWDVCISINYLSKERPNGVMIGFLVNTEQQLNCFDIYKVPAIKFMRIQINEETTKVLGKEPFGIPPYQWIGGIIAPKYGYKCVDDTKPVFEYYGYWNNNTNSHEFTYLYVPVIEEK